ncbi:transposable element Tc1 transposase [Trichonephila clavipes]|nr:transposable element Tc1 transposase [Trichonephila clavipes]
MTYTFSFQFNPYEKEKGRGSLVVKVTDSWSERVMSLSLVLLKTRRLWERCTLNLSRAESDESRFQLCPDYHRRRVWRLQGKRADPDFCIARHTSPQPGVMVKGAISFDSRTPLVVIRDTLTAQRYIDDIMRTVLPPFLLQYTLALFWRR